MTHQNIGIEDAHFALPPCAAIAAFIASIVTGRSGLRSKPFSEDTGFVAGTIANCPGLISTNFIRFLDYSPRTGHTEAGKVIWPFDVRVAVATVLPTIF